MPVLAVLILLASLLLLLGWVWAVSHHLEGETATAAGGPVYEPPTLDVQNHEGDR